MSIMRIVLYVIAAISVMTGFYYGGQALDAASPRLFGLAMAGGVGGAVMPLVFAEILRHLEVIANRLGA